MKKIFLSAAFLLSFVAFSQRELNVGINGGITIGDIEPASSAAFGLDANYLFDWFEDFKVGPSLSAVYFNPKNDTDAYVYIPVGVATRFHTASDEFYVGVDLGYAIGMSPDGDRGGIYFKPSLGYMLNNNLKVNIFYSAVKKKVPAYGYLGLGISFNVLGIKGNDYSY